MKIEMDKDFRGNAYIIQNEDVLLKFSGGFADLANEIPNTLIQDLQLHLWVKHLLPWESFS